MGIKGKEADGQARNDAIRALAESGVQVEPGISHVSRRDFLKVVGAFAGTAAAAGALGGCSPAANTGAAAASDDAAGKATGGATEVAERKGAVALDIDEANKTYLPLNTEYATPVMPAPEQTAYTCDVLVIGGGLAGTNAAVAAAQAGKNVILADKSYPGYSGLSAWPSCTAYWDPDKDIDLETWRDYHKVKSVYFSDLDWEELWARESKGAFDRLKEWGWIEEHDRAVDAEGGAYYQDGLVFHDDRWGYHQANLAHDRHRVLAKILEDNGVTILDHVMIADVIEADGRAAGAVGLHYRSSTPLTIAAKAVCMCTGSGCVKPAGYPLGGDTFDGLWMGYQHGLPITGMEFEDFHQTSSYAPGNIQVNCGFQYSENIWPTGGTVASAEFKAPELIFEGREATYEYGFYRGDWSKVEITEAASQSVAHAGGDESDPRIGKWTSPSPVGDCFGAAPGMPMHCIAGVWCGVDDKEGFTGIPGLWVAGDGTHAANMSGPNYGHERGSMSSFVSIVGDIVGNAAAKYIDDEGVADASLPADKVQEVTDRMMAPQTRERGYEPMWVRNVLFGIIAPGWITVAKSEDSLSSALSDVKRLQGIASGNMIAENGHDLRLCMEVEHQLLAMEMKLKAGLARKESRGLHYRTDYPFKDDANFLHFITYTKGEDGAMMEGQVEEPDEWKGDLSLSYTERYPVLVTPEEMLTYGTEEQKKNLTHYNGVETVVGGGQNEDYGKK